MSSNRFAMLSAAMASLAGLAGSWESQAPSQISVRGAAGDKLRREVGKNWWSQWFFDVRDAERERLRLAAEEVGL